MPFATFSSKPPSATLGVVAGRLDGTDRVLVAFNCLTRIAVFEHSADNGELQFLEDVPLYCSLKYMKIVPILDTDTNRTVRHVLFLLSMKQEIVLATLERTATTAATPASPPPSASTQLSSPRPSRRSLRLTVLYQSAFDDCLHQFNPGEVNLACATGEQCRTPLVAFSVNRGDVYFLDVLAALACSQATANDARKKRLPATEHRLGTLFPQSVLKAIEARKVVTPISRTSFDFTERDVKDMAFGCPRPQGDFSGGVSTTNATGVVSSDAPMSSEGGTTQPTQMTTSETPLPAHLFVLFADTHGRCHVSRYSYATAVSVSVQQPSSSSVFSFSRDVLCDSAARAVREGMVQTNVDPSAAFLSVTVNGIFILGNHLVTYLGFRSSRRKAVTCELPPSPSGNAVLSCACSGSSTSASVHHGDAREEFLMVCFSDGVCGRISVTANTDALSGASTLSAGQGPVAPTCASGTTTALSATTAPGSADAPAASAGLDACGGLGAAPHCRAPRLNIQFFLHVLPTAPTAMASVDGRFWVVASRFADSLLVDLRTGATTVAVKNCGPILDMQVVRDGPRASVVASTGVNVNGGVSLVRSAVTFEEETVVELPDHVVTAHTSGYLIALTMRDGGPRFFCAKEATAASISEVTHLMPPALVASHNAIIDIHGEVDGLKALYTIATRHGLFAVQQGNAPSSADVSGTERHQEASQHHHGRAGGSATTPMNVLATSPFSEEAAFASICGSYCAVAGDAAQIELYRDVTALCCTIPLTSASSCLSTLHLATETLLLYGDWHQETVHVVTLSSADHGATASQSSGAPRVLSVLCVNMSSVPRSLCAIGRRVFVGLLHGAVAEVCADTGVIQQEAVISHLPVELCVVPGQRDTLLCRGAVPILLLVKDSFQVTGLSTNSATSCSTMTLVRPSPPPSHRVPKTTRDGTAPLPSHAEARAGRGHRTGPTTAVPKRRHVHHQYRDSSADEDADGDAAEDRQPSSAVTTLVIWSREDRELVLGTVDQAQKLNQTFLPLHGTVTHIADLPQWDAFAVSVRRPEKDEVLLVPHSFVTNAGAIASPLLTPSAEDSLLENERCVFFEPLRLPTGAAASASNGNSLSSQAVSLLPPPDARTNDPSVSLLVGSTFVFPDEQRARSSRIAWFRCTAAHAPGASGNHNNGVTTTATLQLVGEQDISGALQCCCVVPNYPGRIALGVSGCILTYHWSAVDGIFVVEERCHVGLSLTKLIPLAYPVDPVALTTGETPADSVTAPQASIVALDARHSATYVHVDAVQGSVKVVGRDAKVRGIVDGTCVAFTSRTDTRSDGSGGLCIVDDSLNLFHVEYQKVDRSRGERANDGDGNDNRGGHGATPTRPPRACVVTTAQAHIGDLITCLCPGSLAPSIVTDSALAPSTLIKGIVGQQMVYGTAHGAVGTITPVSRTTHMFLRALEASLRRVETSSTGGFQHSTFREILVTGQERGASRNASFDIPLLQKIATQRRQEEAARACVDGDYVEGFLSLAPECQQRVLRAADVYLRGWARLVHDQRTPSRDDRAVDSDACPSDVPFPEVATVTDVDEQDRLMCNRLLQEDALPLLPLDADAVCAFLRALEWVH